MVKILGYGAMVFCLLLYIASSSDYLTREVMTFKRHTNSPLKSDTYRYGDLFGMSCLPAFQISRDRNSVVNRVRCASERSIDLYALCDSYVWSYVESDSLFCGVNKFEYATINERNRIEVDLDTSKTNILLIEMAERNVRPTLHDDYISSFLGLRHSKAGENLKPADHFAFDDILFHKDINRNIEAIFWETSIFTPIKTFKSKVNYRLFNRIDEQVVISDSERYLFYKPTTDTTSYVSSFQSITSAEFEGMIEKLNNGYAYYRKLGFDEVYLSIIPNPVTILEPGHRNLRHNQLIQQIEGSEKLKMPVVDIYSDFKNSPLELYYRSDTHWNMTGAILWLNKFNQLLAKHSDGRSSVR
jgi:hypothetical protein